MAYPPKDITGQKFGKLVALRRVGSITQHGTTRALWECECECGNRVETTVTDLKRKRRTECGCSRHGMSRTKVYMAWCYMRNRCNNPNNSRFKNYGGRGLVVDPAWVDANGGFQRFYAEVGEPPSDKHSLERIDNDLGYVSGNVKWATPKEQAYNRRSNHLITYKGVTLTVTEWAKSLGIAPVTLFTRLLTYGWSVERAFETPVQERKSASNMRRIEEAMKLALALAAER